MKKFRTAIRFNELTEAEKNRINDALDEARERAGVKKLTREQILEITETVKGFKWFLLSDIRDCIRGLQ